MYALNYNLCVRALIGLTRLGMLQASVDELNTNKFRKALQLLESDPQIAVQDAKGGHFHFSANEPLTWHHHMQNTCVGNSVQYFASHLHTK